MWQVVSGIGVLQVIASNIGSLSVRSQLKRLTAHA
jgi:hypothetical protein